MSKLKEHKLKRKLERKLWKLLSKLIRDNEKFCYTCGSKKNPQAGHFIPWQFESVRYHPDNIHRQCSSCNLRLKSNVPAYVLRLRDEIGEARFSGLMVYALNGRVKTKAEIEMLIKSALLGLPAYRNAYSLLSLY